MKYQRGGHTKTFIKVTGRVFIKSINVSSMKIFLGIKVQLARISQIVPSPFFMSKFEQVTSINNVIECVMHINTTPK